MFGKKKINRRLDTLENILGEIAKEMDIFDGTVTRIEEDDLRRDEEGNMLRCVVCGDPLTGRKEKYCSDRCVKVRNKIYNQGYYTAKNNGK